MRFQQCLKNFQSVMILCSCVLLASCSSTPKTAALPTPSPATGTYPGHYKVGSPYKIENQWYYPKKEEHYSEVGMASWYGPGFHGHRTANGDYYNQQSLTVAHRTLPLPSIVRVTNVANGKSVIAMVNDRGPFSKKRIIDVSERVADLIGIKQQGTGKVRVEYMPEQSKQLLQKLALAEKDSGISSVSAKKIAHNHHNVQNTQLAAATTAKVDSYTGGAEHFLQQEKAIFIQAGAYTRKENANYIAARLAKFGTINIQQINDDSGIIYRVRLGPIDDSKNANRMLEEIINAGNTNAIIVGKNG